MSVLIQDRAHLNDFIHERFIYIRDFKNNNERI